MNNRRTLSIILIAFFSASLLLCGTVMAYMFRQTQYEENLFTAASVSCAVEEKFDGVNKESIVVKNTGNIDAYLRVKLVSYWVDTEGNIVGKPSDMPEMKPASGWLAGTDHAYYYQSTVGPGMLTEELLATPIVLEIDSAGYLQVVEVFAEAIQSQPQKAVIGSWGVSLDSGGNITAVP